jgi:hypothetical protein
VICFRKNTPTIQSPRGAKFVFFCCWKLSVIGSEVEEL